MSCKLVDVSQKLKYCTETDYTREDLFIILEERVTMTDILVHGVA